jgi:Protein of unknown function (DUF4231)
VRDDAFMTVEPQDTNADKQHKRRTLRFWRQEEQADQTRTPAKYSELRSQLVAAHPDAARSAYINGRWLDAVIGARESMKRDQRMFRRVNLVTLGAAAVSPVLVTSTAATTGHLNTGMTVAAIVVSLIAAVGGVLLQTLRPGIRWRLHRTLRDQLEALAWGRLVAASTESSQGKSDVDTWPEFVAQVETAIRLHNAAYSQEVAGVLGSTPGSGQSASAAND